MSVVVVGLSHRTVPLELLERMTVSKAGLPKALGDLGAREFVTEAVILSTCHRVEVYAVAEKFHGAVGDVRHLLSELAFVPPEDFSDHLYTYYDEAAVAHLFSVAAGLDSVIIGESQVLGQVRQAWEAARAEGVAGARLSALFRHALEVGKRARSDTAIGRGIASLAQAAVAMAHDHLGSLTGRHVVVLGAGEMGEGMATDLAEAGTVRQLVVASRSWDRARGLAARTGGEAIPLGGLPEALRQADVLFTSTGSASVVVEHDDVAEAVAHRDGRPLLIVDLAMPRDVDPGIARLPGVTLFDLDDLQGFVDAGLDSRRQEAARVQAIVAEEVERFTVGAAAREVAPTVAALRETGERLRLAELARHEGRLSALDPRQQEIVDLVTRRVVAKLLHEPTVRLKDAAGSPRGERLAAALQELFDL